MDDPARPIRVGFYTPANLNLIDGSAIWVQSVAETLHADPRVHITIPLKMPEQRDVITGLLRRLDRVKLVSPVLSDRRSPSAMTHEEALDLLEELDAVDPFDIVLLRAYDLCRAAVGRRRFKGRLWSCYILEPEKDAAAADYIDGMAAIARASRHVVCQSEEMRALLESLVPDATGRTILLPPAIPASTVTRPDPRRIVRRMIYTGKFHPFYVVPEMVGFFENLRTTYPDLEFHVAGDKIYRPPGEPEFATRLERLLSGTDGLVWHGGVSRDAIERLLAGGGIALSLWDHRHGSEMNDLVISTKLLDYCSVGLPVILNRTAAQESMLGPDYPLFVERPSEALPLLRRLLEESDLYREASARTFEATRRFTYPAVMDRLRPYLVHQQDPAGGPTDGQDDLPKVDMREVDRPKLPGAALNLGVVCVASSLGSPSESSSSFVHPESDPALDQVLELLAALRAADDRFRLIVRLPDSVTDGGPMRSGRPTRLGDRSVDGGRSPELIDAITVVSRGDGLASWLRTVGFVIAVAPPTAAGPIFDAAAASGTIPVDLTPPASDGRTPGTEIDAAREGWVVGPVEEVAEAIAALVLQDRWAGRSEELRTEARRRTFPADGRPALEPG